MRAVLIMNVASGTSTMATTEGTSEEHQEAILAALRTHGIEAEVRQRHQKTMAQAWRHKRQQSRQTWSSPQVAMALSTKSPTGWLARTAPLE